MGNCGFTLAPCAASERHLVVKNLERAEDIAAEAMEAGIEGKGTTFPEFLDCLEGLPKGINYTGYLGHCALRTYVMGELAFEQAATEDELRAIERELRDPIRAAADGRMFAQVHSRGLNVVLSFKTQLPFDHLPAWKPFRALPLVEQRERLRDPETRRRLIAGAHATPERRALGTEARPFPYEWIFLFDTVAGPHRTVAEIARERGVDPAEAMIDLALERDLERFFVHPVANDDQDAVLEMMRHPRAVVTFS